MISVISAILNNIGLIRIASVSCILSAASVKCIGGRALIYYIYARPAGHVERIFLASFKNKNKILARPFRSPIYGIYVC